MRIKTGDVLAYKDAACSKRYGTGVVTAITAEEYTILWSGRGLTRYRRLILDERLDRVFERADGGAGLPKERHLHLGPSKLGIPFNENYDRDKVAELCQSLKLSGGRKAAVVADGLKLELFTKKFALRGSAKTTLLQLSELCNARGSAGCDDAQNISKELFFGYVLRKTDFEESSV